MKIQEIDKNFAIKTGMRENNVRVYDVCAEPFTVYGLIKPTGEEDKFCRLPEKMAKKVSEGVLFLHSNTAGGRVRFATDSKYIAVYAKLPSVGRIPHFALSGSAGFDLYAEEDGEQKFIKSFIPDFEIKDTLEGEIELSRGEMREYTLNFPLYSDVSKLYIILEDSAEVRKCRSYKYEKPVVYYGSSITQGGCASRPGNSYQAVLSRRFDCNYINLGFSGNAKGEKEIAEYISGLDMSVFVYDYDHNASSAEYLKNTHEPMFKLIREKHPDLPVICLTQPVNKCEDFDLRKQIIRDTVDNAKANGDKNIYFIDGSGIMSELGAGDGVTVDGCHPNDLGFFCMANIIGRVLGSLLK